MADVNVLTVNCLLEVLDSEDRKGDEPRLDFAFITLLHGNAHVAVRSTRELAKDFLLEHQVPQI